MRSDSGKEKTTQVKVFTTLSGEDEAVWKKGLLQEKTILERA